MFPLLLLPWIQPPASAVVRNASRPLVCSVFQGKDLAVIIKYNIKVWVFPESFILYYYFMWMDYLAYMHVSAYYVCLEPMEHKQDTKSPVTGISNG